MLKSVNAFYDEITPIGTRELFRITTFEIIDEYCETNASVVRKAVAFILKLDRNGNRLCDSIRFDFWDGTSWLCEYKWDDWNRNNRLITVAVIDEYSTTVDSYKTDKASLQRGLLAMLPKKSVA